MLVFSKTVYINLSISQFTSQFLSCFQWESWRAPAVPIYSYAWICTYRNATDAGFMDCHRDLFLGEILLLLLAQHFPFLLFLSFSVHTAATTRDEWIHGRRTKKSRSYSVWNGKRGMYHMNTFFSPKSLANICAGTLQKSLVFLLFVVEADQTRKNTNKCFFEAEVWEVWWTCSRGETI